MGAEDFDRYIGEIRETLRKWNATGASYANMSHVQALKGRDRQKFWRQGLYSEAERAVTVSFSWRVLSTYRRRQIELTVRSYKTPWENAEALAKGLEAVRLAEVRGSTRVIVQLLRQMFPVEQREAPPPPRDEPRQTNTPRWAKTLHISADAPLEVAEAAYRALSRAGAHPDVGGSHERMKALNLAIEEAWRVLGRAS
jgi:hypothetical protein